MSRLEDMQSRPIEEQAAAWLMAFEDGSPDADLRRAFVAWTKESPCHIEEFLEVSAIHLELCESDVLADTIDSLVAQASENVVDLGEATLEQKNRSVRKISWLYGAVASVLVAIAAGLSLTGGIFNQPDSTELVYQTGVGEQRSIVLDDESTLTLNTQSRVSVVYTDTGRHATLHQGEAMFEVEKDPSRPFTVDAGFLDVLVVGTVFNIYRQDEKAIVTVVEGKVDVQYSQGADMATQNLPTSNTGSGDNTADDRLHITAGEQLAIAETGLLARLEMESTDKATAWTERRLVFDNEPMSEVLKEFNRYNNRKLVLNYPELAERQVTAVFDARDADSILQFVESHSRVDIVRMPDSIIIKKSYR